MKKQYVDDADKMIFVVRKVGFEYEFERLKSSYERNFEKHVDHPQHFGGIGYLVFEWLEMPFAHRSDWHLGTITHTNKPAMNNIVLNHSALVEAVNNSPMRRKFWSNLLLDEVATPVCPCVKHSTSRLIFGQHGNFIEAQEAGQQ